MGRGRAKAKQIKVARKLKYNSGPTTDLTALERELHGANGGGDTAYAPDDEEHTDPFADDEDDDYGSWAASGSR